MLTITTTAFRVLRGIVVGSLVLLIAVSFVYWTVQCCTCMYVPAAGVCGLCLQRFKNQSSWGSRSYCPGRFLLRSSMFYFCSSARKLSYLDCVCMYVCMYVHLGWEDDSFGGPINEELLNTWIQDFLTNNSDAPIDMEKILETTDLVLHPHEHVKEHQHITIATVNDHASDAINGSLDCAAFQSFPNSNSKPSCDCLTSNTGTEVTSSCRAMSVAPYRSCDKDPLWPVHQCDALLSEASSVLVDSSPVRSTSVHTLSRRMASFPDSGIGLESDDGTSGDESSNSQLFDHNCNCHIGAKDLLGTVCSECTARRSPGRQCSGSESGVPDPGPPSGQLPDGCQWSGPGPPAGCVTGSCQTGSTGKKSSLTGLWFAQGQRCHFDRKFRKFSSFPYSRLAVLTAACTTCFWKTQVAFLKAEVPTSTFTPRPGMMLGPLMVGWSAFQAVTVSFMYCMHIINSATSVHPVLIQKWNSPL